MKKNSWYFLNGFAGKRQEKPIYAGHIRTYCRKAEYGVLFLVTEEVLREIKYDRDVSGFSIIASYQQPYPLYAVGVDTDDVQRLVDKYKIEAVLHTLEPTIELTV